MKTLWRANRLAFDTAFNMSQVVCENIEMRRQKRAAYQAKLEELRQMIQESYKKADAENDS